jgi:hypothetical protein
LKPELFIATPPKAKKPPEGYKNPLEALYSISSGKIFSQFYPEV